MQHSPSGRTELTTGCNRLELKDVPSVDTDVADEDEDEEDDKEASLETPLSLTVNIDVVLLTTATDGTVLPPRALKSKSSPSSSSTTWSKTTT